MDGGRHMRQVLGRSFFLLVADLRRSGTRIGRGSFYCGVALFDADGDPGQLRGGRIGAD